MYKQKKWCTAQIYHLYGFGNTVKKHTLSYMTLNVNKDDHGPKSIENLKLVKENVENVLQKLQLRNLNGDLRTLLNTAPGPNLTKC